MDTNTSNHLVILGGSAAASFVFLYLINASALLLTQSG